MKVLELFLSAVSIYEVLKADMEKLQNNFFRGQRKSPNFCSKNFTLGSYSPESESKPLIPSLSLVMDQGGF